MATYDALNSLWPEHVPIPTGPEAIAGVKRLIKFAYRHAIAEGVVPKYARPIKRRFKLTSGRRYTYPRRGVWHVNPNRGYFDGWKDIVHEVSHWAQRSFWPDEKGHGPRHAYLEKMMVEYVVKSGWLAGKLAPKSKSAPVDVFQLRAARVASRIAGWEAKKRRAETALKKLYRQKAYYARKDSMRQMHEAAKVMLPPIDQLQGVSL